MATLRKFMFETRFEGAGPGGLPAAGQAAKPRPVFTEQEFAAAREEAFAEGLAEGRERARREIEFAAAEALRRIGEEFASAQAALAQAIAGIEAEAVRVAATIARKLAPQLLRQNELAEIEALVSASLKTVLNEPRVVVRVDDRLLDPLKERIAGLAERSGYAGKVVLVADERIRGSDCRIEWADGGAERDLAWISGQIDEAVERYLAARAQAPSVPPDSASPAAAGPRSLPETP